MRWQVVSCECVTVAGRLVFYKCVTVTRRVVVCKCVTVTVRGGGHPDRDCIFCMSGVARQHGGVGGVCEVRLRW